MCTGRGSNQGPLGPKSDALTAAPLRHLPYYSKGRYDKFSTWFSSLFFQTMLTNVQLNCCYVFYQRHLFINISFQLISPEVQQLKSEIARLTREKTVSSLLEFLIFSPPTDQSLLAHEIRQSETLLGIEISI